ncbi:MAG: hypothetical protein IKF65_10165 [Clostridia bacterium]|nr:hypothetical protein [Clostridia bacterium]
MKEFTVPMALVDFIPVLLFAAASVILMRDLYNKMSKGAFALFAAGTIDVTCAGALKALYKLLYAAGVCDFTPLSDMFFPVQSIGFLLGGIGILAMLVHKQKETSAAAIAPVVFKGTFVFVGFMIAGFGMMNAVLSVLAKKIKKPGLIVLFVLAWVCMLAMGYLSARDFAQASMNWIAQGVNIVGQGSFFLGALLAHRNGLSELKLHGGEMA